MNCRPHAADSPHHALKITDIPSCAGSRMVLQTSDGRVWAIAPDHANKGKKPRIEIAIAPTVLIGGLLDDAKGDDTTVVRQQIDVGTALYPCSRMKGICSCRQGGYDVEQKTVGISIHRSIALGVSIQT